MHNVKPELNKYWYYVKNRGELRYEFFGRELHTRCDSRTLLSWDI